MKTLSFFKTAVLIAAIPFLFSCEKESLSELKATTESELGKTDSGVERPFKGKLLSSTEIKPDIGAGWVYPNPVPAWYPGEGEGNATHMGKFWVYFNQYISAINEQTGEVTVMGAPANMFYSSQLLEKGITVPDEVVYVIWDEQGNSIWGKPGSGGYQYQFIEGTTRIEITSQVEIIGGTGRFAGATGHFTITGYSDVDALTGTTSEALTYDGVIIY